MAAVHRALSWCVGLLLLVAGWLPLPAAASFPATSTSTGCTVSPCYEYAISGKPWRADRITACLDFVYTNSTYFYKNHRVTTTGGAPGFGVCTADLHFTSSGAYVTTNTTDLYGQTVAPVAPTYSCPANSALSGTSCTCNAPNYAQNATNDGCVSAQSACPPLGEIVGGTSGQQYGGGAGYTGGLLCINSCSSYPSSSWKSSDGKWYASGPLVSVGTFCTGAAEGGGNVEPPVLPPVMCPTGQCPGQVNGIDVCMPCSTGVTSSTPSSTTTIAGPQPSASSPSTPVPGTTSDTGTVKTECTGLTCTTTRQVTTSNPDGTTSTTAAIEKQTKDDYCKDHPRSALCIVSSFSGNCAGTFKGEGDALAAATAEAVNKVKCFLDPGTATDSVKSQLEAGTFAAALPNTQKSVSNFDQTNPLNSSCPGDQVVTVLGASVSIPLSSACGALQALGYIAIAFTLIYSTVFVVKGF